MPREPGRRHGHLEHDFQGSFHVGGIGRWKDAKAGLGPLRSEGGVLDCRCREGRVFWLWLTVERARNESVDQPGRRIYGFP